MIREADKNIVKMLEAAERKTNGLTLVSAATGKGKTTEVIRRAVRWLDEGRFDKVIVIEPRHSILNEIKERIEGLTSRNILYLKSALENVLQYISNVDGGVFKDKVISQYIDDLKSYSKSCRNENATDKERELFREKIRDTKNQLKRYCIKNIKKIGEDELNELEKIFPERVSKEHDFILMTMDKLFYTLDTLDKDNRILSGRMFNDKTLVIIDELDKCYSIALNNCADNRDTLDDMLVLIQNAYAFISDRDRRWQSFSDEQINEDIESRKRTLLEEITELDSKFGILNNFVYEEKDDDSLELFVSRAKTFVAGKHHEYKMTRNENSTIIRRADYNSNINIVELAVACKRTVRHCVNLVYKLGEAYRKDKDPSASYEDGLVYGIGQIFNKTLDESTHYKNYIIDNSIKTQALLTATGEYEDDDNVCNNGFTHVIFDNQPGSNHTYLKSAGMDLTPENIFAWMAKRSNVIGLSATQQIPTVLNLSLEYMEKVLEGNFNCYSDEDFKVANNSLPETKNVIHCDVISSLSSDRTKLLSSINEILAEEGIQSNAQLKSFVGQYADAIDRRCPNESMKDREYKRFLALCQFFFRRKAVSGIVILNSKFYYLEELQEFIKHVSRLLGFENIDANNIHTIDAKNLETEIEVVRDKLNNGAKCLIISNKEAVGQGVNMQYKRDFNFFYQEDPTFVLPYADSDGALSVEDKTKLTYLVMKMNSEGEIGDYEVRHWVSYISSNQPHELKKYQSVKNAKTAIFIQGLGRANRNSEKEEHEYIFFDEELCDVLNLKDLTVEKTRELIEVENRIDRYMEERDQMYLKSMNITERALLENSNTLQKKIQTLLTTFTHKNMTHEREQALKEYKELLSVLYKYGPWPTGFDRDDAEIFEKLGYVKVENPVSSLYVLSKTGAYCEDLVCLSIGSRADFQNIRIDSINNVTKYPMPDGECWMINPKAFNLLQGIAGERRFADVFEKYCKDYKLEELSLDEYEVCGDFRITDTVIYVDVKNYSEEYGRRDMSVFAQEKLSVIRKHNPDGMLIVVNTYANKKYINTNSANILIISSVIEGKTKNWESINTIESWIESNT